MASKKKNQTPLLLRFVSWAFPKIERIAPSLAHKYFIHIFYTPFRYKLPAKEVEFIKGAKKFSVTVDEKYIQCYRWGDTGPKVLLIHGWAGRAGQFRKMIPHLVASGFQVVAFDGPAHGRSDGKQTDLIEFGEVLKKIVGSEGPFVGAIAHSFGGVAILYAIMNGLPVPKLINISSPTIGSEVLGTYLRTINASKATGEAFDRYLLQKYGKPFEEFSSLYFVKHLQAPLDLLAIQDENDREVAVVNATELKKAYPAATIHLTKGLGHTRILKDEGVIGVCIDFLKG